MNSELDVMIVDDEILVANLLKNSVDWGKLGMRVSRIATSASEAFDMLEEQKADIIFTDINMPVMNGLTFSKRILSLYPQIKIIVLTGFNEFEYARESVSIGILEYLQKPIKAKEIMAAANRAREQIFAERKIISDYTNLRNQFDANIEFLREKFFLSLALGTADESRIESTLKAYDIEVAEDHLQFAVLDIIPDEQQEEKTKYFLNDSALKLIKMTYEQPGRLYIFEDAYQRIVMFSISEEINLFDYLSQITSYLQEQIPCRTNVGIGGIHCWEEHSKLSYDEACAALKFSQSNLENEIADISDIIMEKEIADNFNLDGIEDISFFVRLGITNKALDALHTVFSKLNVDSCSMNMFKTVASGVISGITQSIILSSISGLEAFQEQTVLMTEIYSVDDKDEVIAILSDYVVKTTEKIAHVRQKKQNTFVSAAKQYLDENIAEPSLSLTTVANILGYNKSYFSRLFKQETGKSFSDYLLTLRMTKAMTLLRTTEMRSYQIAEKIGYLDPNYFSVCFKKFTGMTVSEYRAKG